MIIECNVLNCLITVYFLWEFLTFSKLNEINFFLQNQLFIRTTEIDGHDSLNSKKDILSSLLRLTIITFSETLL